MSLSDSLAALYSLLSSVRMGFLISVLLLLIAYVDMKNGVTNTRSDRQTHIESRLADTFRLQSGYHAEKSLEIEIKNIWVTENNRWWYAFRKYLPFYGGFAGTTTVKIASEGIADIDRPRFFNCLVSYPLKEDIADIQFSSNTITFEFDSTNPDEVDELIHKCRHVILEATGPPYGDSTEHGVIRPIIVKLQIPSGLFHRLLSRLIVQRLQALDSYDQVILWNTGSNQISRRRLSIDVYSSNDAPRKESTDVTDLYSYTSDSDSWADALYNQSNSFIQLLQQIEAVVTDVHWGEESSRQYTTRNGTFTSLEFLIAPSRDIHNPEGVFGTITMTTEEQMFFDPQDDEGDITVGEQYSMNVPVSGFVPADMKNELDLQPRHRKNIPEDEVSERYLKEHSDAVAITCTGYTLESYYEYEDGEFFTVRWRPGKQDKIWLHEQRVPDLPINKTGITIWERTEST